MAKLQPTRPTNYGEAVRCCNTQHTTHEDPRRPRPAPAQRTGAKPSAHFGRHRGVTSAGAKWRSACSTRVLSTLNTGLTTPTASTHSLGTPSCW